MRVRFPSAASCWQHCEGLVVRSGKRGGHTLHTFFNDSVTQLAEILSLTQKVVGSTPTGITLLIGSSLKGFQDAIWELFDGCFVFVVERKEK